MAASVLAQAGLRGHLNAYVHTCRACQLCKPVSEAIAAAYNLLTPSQQQQQNPAPVAFDENHQVLSSDEGDSGTAVDHPKHGVLEQVLLGIATNGASVSQVSLGSSGLISRCLCRHK